MTSVYTVIDEGYNVDVYRSKRAIIDWAFASALLMESGPATRRALSAALKAEGCVELFDSEDSRSARNWTYKIDRH